MGILFIMGDADRMKRSELIDHNKLKIFKRIKIADFITIGNGICGFLAMLSLHERWGEHLSNGRPFFLPALALIVMGMILDGLDGEVARWELKRFGVKNRIGHYLDSISDTITFCIAPAYLLYSVYRLPWSTISGWGIAINAGIVLTCVLVAAFGILRLGKFVTSGHKLDVFIGLPTPANAFIICVLCFLFTDHWYITMPVAVLMGFLMISDYRYPKLHGKVKVIFGFLILLFVVSLSFMVFNIGNRLTEMELSGYNISATLALGVVLFYALGSPILLELKERKLVDLDLERDL